MTEAPPTIRNAERETRIPRVSLRPCRAASLLAALALPACAGKNLQKENDALQVRLAEREAAVARVETEAAAQAKTLKDDLRKLEVRLTDAARDKEALEATVAKMSAERDAAQADRLRSKEALDAFRKEIERLEAEAGALSKEVEHLRFLQRQSEDP